MKKVALILYSNINEDIITCAASEVLKAGHGICFAKSHLLAALLRCKSIPTGFCYQKLILDDEVAPVLVYHGLNGVYMEYRTKVWVVSFGVKLKNYIQIQKYGKQLLHILKKEIYIFMLIDADFIL